MNVLWLEQYNTLYGINGLILSSENSIAWFRFGWFEMNCYDTLDYKWMFSESQKKKSRFKRNSKIFFNLIKFNYAIVWKKPFGWFEIERAFHQFELIHFGIDLDMLDDYIKRHILYRDVDTCRRRRCCCYSNVWFLWAQWQQNICSKSL